MNTYAKLFKVGINRDERGFFCELFKQSMLPWMKPTQWNLSSSVKNTVRGIHWQKNRPQGKYITVLTGRITDVVYNIATQKFDVYELQANSGDCLWIPPGFGHGFWARENSLVLYACTENEYSPYDERGLNPLRPIGFPWEGEKDLLISEKDLAW